MGMGYTMDYIYDLKNVIPVKFTENYKNYLESNVLEKLGNIEYFPDKYYFLNHELIKNADGTYLEIYEDAILGIILYERVIKKDENSLPKFIKDIKPFELQGLTEDEKTKGLVGSSKLFYNFQIINQKEASKKKKLGIRRVG